MSLRRRDLLAAGAALALPGCRGGRVPENLVPDSPCPTPSYWSTWGVQRLGDPDVSRRREAFARPDVAADRLTESNLFGPEGWAQAFKAVHGDMILLLDRGWNQAPGSAASSGFQSSGWMEISEAKFPSLTGGASQRLAKLSDRLRLLGWKGLGITASVIAPAGMASELYFRDQLRAGHQSGVLYWKLASRGRLDVRAQRDLSELASGEAPNLVIENSFPWGPLNDQINPGSVHAMTGSGRFRTWDQGQILETALEIAAFSRVFRTGETTPQLAIPTTLDRVAELLLRGGGDRGNDFLLNCEDEAYMAAALGCTMGVMRHPALRPPADGSPDPRLLRYRTTEVVRALRWQRIAPPWPVGYTKTDLDGVRLEDDWRLGAGDTVDAGAAGLMVRQGAPARVARNTTLPAVSSEGTMPFIVSSRHPNGATAVAALPRVFAGRGVVYGEADVSVEVEDPMRPIGVFGRFRSLTLDLVAPPPAMRVMAQDLASDKAEDITERVNLAGSTMVIPGDLINKVGQSASPRDDQSDPGLIIQIFRE
ncbi:MAG: hypothetical protein IH602_21595 [Bryobacteraceae bacterium]|nr:hypothetical protein [Bryobacteraceae bacterium]